MKIQSTITANTAPRKSYSKKYNYSFTDTKPTFCIVYTDNEITSIKPKAAKKDNRYKKEKYSVMPLTEPVIDIYAIKRAELARQGIYERNKQRRKKR